MRDLIDRQEAIDIVRNIIVKEVTPAYMLIDKAEVMTELMMMPPAEPERPEQDILAWLLAYHMKSFDLNGRYMAHEVIGWLVHDFATAYMAEKREE